MASSSPNPSDTTSLAHTRPHSLVEEMEDSFLDYSMSVIVQRALPDARDGLKPVHRRILAAMYDEKLFPDRGYKKSAAVVGETLGKYHPHGDSAVYDAMVRMAQPFSMNEPLVDGHGNFGSLDGDSAAAYRYTEARMTEAAAEMLRDIEKDTVAFTGTFDDRHREPTVLPTRLPNLLLNGTEGIAVGMATKIPPHNLREIGAAIERLCDDPNVENEAIYDLIQGPDFPTGGLVLSGGGIERFLTSGQGKMRMRARVHAEKARGGRTYLVFTEIPYGVVKTTILEGIARQVKRANRGGWAASITDLRDESDRSGVRIVVELKRGAEVKKVLARLYKKTSLARTYGGKLLALVDGEPRMLSVRQALEIFIDHRLEVIRRRSQHDLKAAENRAHILEGLLVAIDAVEEVVDLIRRSRRRDTARKKLVKTFDLSEDQANAILDLRLARLTAMDVKTLEEELEERRALIEELRSLLADENKQRAVVREETREMVERFGRPRRTEIVSRKRAETVAEQAADEYVRLELTARGRVYAKLVGQKRGGRRTRDQDPSLYRFSLKADDRVVLFTESGTAYSLYPKDVLDKSASTPTLSSVVEGLGLDEEILWAAEPDDFGVDDGYVVFVTEQGRAKRTALSEYEAPRAGGLISAGRYEGDRILAVLPVREGMDLLVTTARGQAIRFPVDDVPVHGRTARGVKAIDLQAGDRVVGASRIAPQVVVLTRSGYGKRVAGDEFPTQGRGGKGVKLSRVTERTGEIVCSLALGETNHLLLATADEETAPIRLAPADLPEMGRSAMGNRIAPFSDGVTPETCWLLQSGPGA